MKATLRSVSPSAATAILAEHGYGQAAITTVVEHGGLITAVEAAHLLGMKTGGVRATANRGLLKIERLGGTKKRCVAVLVHANSVRAYLDRRDERRREAA